MSKITLRSYNEEIQALTDQGKIDEAIAHCQHILTIFPKHVDTYRLLGKAYLESQRLGDAADIFQRVLSAVPEDFVSHIGMSIIREDEGNLNAAIWHMQRAFDVQSSNITIQDELRRLYGKRDGIEPPKIRLTRAALAYMYAQGDLIDESIAELRTALKEEPERMDMLLLLARMYHRNQGRIQTIQICGQVLNKLPFCLEANIIISQALRETNREGEAASYVQRARELDPYVAYISPEAPRADLVPEAAITINKLSDVEIRGLLHAEKEQPSWAATLGVDVRGEANQEEDIDWLLTESSSGIEDDPELVASLASSPAFAFDEMEEVSTEDTAPEPAEMQEEIQETSSSQEDQIPDWMKEAGWGPSRERTTSFGTPTQAPEPEIELPPEEDDEEIVPAEIPDWLQSMAPENLADETAPQDAEEDILELGIEETDIPEWMSELNADDDDQLTAIPGELPDWLKDLGPAQTSTVVQSGERFEEESESGEMTAEPPDTLPDWLLDSETEAELERENAQAENLPAWLNEIGEESGETGDAETEEASQELEGMISELGALEAGVSPEEREMELAGDELDWLTVEDEAGEDAATEVESEDQEVPSWLADLAVEQEVEAASEPLSEKLEQADLPDWLSELSTEEGAETQAELESQGGELPEGSVELSEWVPETLVPDAEISEQEDEGLDQEDEEIPDWVEQLASDPTAAQGPSTGVTQWLEKHEQDLAGSEAEVEEITEEEPAAEKSEDLPVWLQEFDTELVSKEDEEFAEPAEMAKAIEGDPNIPDWLQNLDAEISESYEPSEVTMDGLEEQAEVTMEEQNDLPELPDMDDSDAALRWLENLAANQGASEEELLTSPEERSESPPDWLQDMVEQESEGGDMTEMAVGAETVLEVPDSEQAEEVEAAEEMEPEAEEMEPTADEMPEPEEAGDLMAETVLEMGEEEPEMEAESPGGTWVQQDPLPDWLTEDASETVMESEADETESEMSDLESMDPDKALAWLEGLAAKQGADESELLTEPGERDEDLPDWLTQAEAEHEEEEGSTAETVIAQVEEAAEAAVESEESEETGQEELEEMAAAGWIDSLVEDEPAGEGEAEPAGEEVPAWLVDELDEETEEPEPELPDWLQGVDIEEEEGEGIPEMAAPSAEVEPAEELQEEPETEEAEEAEEAAVPDWLRETIISESPFPQTLDHEEEVEAEDVSPPEWVSSEMEPPEDTEEEAEYAWMAPDETEEAKAGEVAEEEAQAESPAEETPSLAADTIPSSTAFEGLETELAAEEEGEAEPVEAAIEESIEAEIIEEEVVQEEAVEEEVFEEEVEEEIEAEPVAQEAAAPDGLEWPSEEEEEMEWLSAESEMEPAGLIEEEETEEPETMWPTEGAFEAEAEELESAPAMSLNDARSALSSGDLSAALESYSKLISNRSNLDDIIADLKEAIEYNHPVNVEVWQTLGDAHARNNQLQDALDAYTQAEELLR